MRLFDDELNEEICSMCSDCPEADLILCGSCPRSYCVNCLTKVLSTEVAFLYVSLHVLIYMVYIFVSCYFISCYLTSVCDLKLDRNTWR